MSSDYTWEWEQVELSSPVTSIYFSFNTEPAVHMLGIVSMGHISDVALHVNCRMLSMPIIMLASTSVNPLVICVPLSLSFSEPLSFQIWRRRCGSSLQHTKLQPSLVPITSLQLTVLNNFLSFYSTKGALPAPVLSKLCREKISHRTTTLISSKKLLLTSVSFTLLSPVHLTLSLVCNNGMCFFRSSPITFNIVYTQQCWMNTFCSKRFHKDMRQYCSGLEPSTNNAIAATPSLVIALSGLVYSSSGGRVLNIVWMSVRRVHDSLISYMTHWNSEILCKPRVPILLSINN